MSVSPPFEIVFIISVVALVVSILKFIFAYGLPVFILIPFIIEKEEQNLICGFYAKNYVKSVG